MSIDQGAAAAIVVAILSMVVGWWRYSNSLAIWRTKVEHRLKEQGKDIQELSGTVATLEENQRERNEQLFTRLDSLSAGVAEVKGSIDAFKTIAERIFPARQDRRDYDRR